MSSSDDVSDVALVVSLVALIVTVAQLLAQVFATADGYRRCQPSVMGPWARRTTLRWRWSQFRFECLFMIPELSLECIPSPTVPSSTGMSPSDSHRNEKTPSHSAILPVSIPVRDSGKLPEAPFVGIPIEGNSESMAATMTPAFERWSVSDELVCWIPFLQALHQHAKAVLSHEDQGGTSKPFLGSNNSWPTVKFRQRSWDFMPTEAVRPLALSYVSDIAIMAWRMGMTWSDFRPNEGVLKAEGGPHVLTSISVRGVGLVLEYRHNGQGLGEQDQREGRKIKGLERAKNRTMCIYSEEANHFIFGILPGNPDFSLPDYEIGGRDEFLRTLEELHGSDGSSARDALKGVTPNSFQPGVSDIICLAAPMIRQRGSRRNQVYVPGYWCGMTYFHVGYLVYYQRLKEHMDSIRGGTEQMEWIIEQYEYLHSSYGDRWDGNKRYYDQLPPLEFQEDLHDRYDITTDYFRRLEARSENSRILYLDLLKAHLLRAPHSFGAALGNVNRGNGREHFNTGDQSWRGEAMHMYFDYIPDHVKYLKQKTKCRDETLIYEAWFMLIFRGFLWQRAHNLSWLEDGGKPLPAVHYGSRFPVYIG